VNAGDGVTLQGVPGEAQLADDVSGDVRLDALTLLGMALCCFQQVVELLRVKFLQGERERERETGRTEEENVYRKKYSRPEYFESTSHLHCSRETTL